MNQQDLMNRSQLWFSPELHPESSFVWSNDGLASGLLAMRLFPECIQACIKTRHARAATITRDTIGAESMTVADAIILSYILSGEVLDIDGDSTEFWGMLSLASCRARMIALIAAMTYGKGTTIPSSHLTPSLRYCDIVRCMLLNKSARTDRDALETEDVNNRICLHAASAIRCDRNYPAGLFEIVYLLDCDRELSRRGHSIERAIRICGFHSEAILYWIKISQKSLSS